MRYAIAHKIKQNKAIFSSGNEDLDYFEADYFKMKKQTFCFFWIN
jgi:hypothetical protein